jgi:gliding motility-associated-like protein
MRTVLLSLLILFTSLSALVQGQEPAVEWQKCYGGGEGDYGKSITPTSDGGYIMAGYAESIEGDITASKGTIDYWIVKINSSGNIQWQKNFGGRSWDMASAIHETSDGGYIVGGNAASMDGDLTGRTSANMDFWVLKLSSTGMIEWQKNYGGSLSEYLYDLKITNDGYVLAGFSESTNGDLTKNNGLRDFWVVKISKTGVLQWQKTYGGSLEDEAREVEVTSDGGYIVTGHTESNDGDVSGNHGRWDTWVLKLDGNGMIQWKKCLGGSLFEEGNAVKQTADGGYLITGMAGSNDGDVSGNHATGFLDFWVVKLNSSGSIEWQKCYGGGFNDVAYTLDATSDGGFLIAGSSESANGDVTCNRGQTDYWVIKINSSGVLQWQKSLGASSFEEIHSVRQTPDGGTILAGHTAHSGSTTVPGYHPNLHDTGGDYWLVKLTAQLFTSPDPSVTISIPSTDVCAGGPYIFTAQAVASEIRTYQWYLNGVAVGVNSSTYNASTIRSGDVIKCIVTVTIDCSNRQVQSNTITMHSGQDIAPEVTTIATTTSICSGSSITFTATNKSGNPNPSYQWTVNGQNVGTNSTVYTTSSLTNGSTVICRMTVPQCGGGSTKDDSDPIVVTVKPVLNPSIQIETANTMVCKNIPVVFKAKIIDGGLNPVYQWKVNGISTGSSSSDFTINNLNDGDEVSCILHADVSGACSSQASANSNAIKMKVVEDKPATINIFTADNNICKGTAVQFSAQVENGGTNPSFSWRVNGLEKADNKSVFTTTELADGDKITCVLNTNNVCAVSNNISSNVIVMAVREVPKITISPSDTVVAAGTQLQLNGKIEGSVSSYQWSPLPYFVTSSSLQPVTISLEEDVTFKLAATGSNGCSNEKQITIAVTTGLYIPNSFSPNNDGINDLFRIPPRTRLIVTRFSIFDRWGNQVFTTSDNTKGWDGKYKGQIIPGTYVYIISGTHSDEEVVLKGTVVLIK